LKILAIESSGASAGVCVLNDDAVVAEFSVNSFTHSETLAPLIEAMFKFAKLRVNDMDFVACSAGPGSFTGLRIGAALAKSIAYGIKKPVIPVPTLDAMEKNVIYSGDKIVAPAIDARNGRVYAAFYKNGSRVSDYMAIDKSTLENENYIVTADSQNARTVALYARENLRLANSPFEIIYIGGKL
jgi:tRNA threonylcarbamoyl adenosine modification protein YeaZ